MRNNNSPVKFDILLVTTGEVTKALEGMQRRKSIGEDKITTYLLKDGEEMLLEKLAAFYTKRLLARRVPES